MGIVFNPYAGGLKGAGRARLDAAVRTFEAAGSKVALFSTPGPNRAGELAQAAAANGCTLVLAAGGDGTINEVINGIAGTDIPFGALPSGTANVLACEIGLAGRPDRAASQLLQCVPTRIPLGRLDRPGEGTRYFLLMAGIGLDAQIVYHLDLKLKQRFGKLAYWHGGFAQLGGNIPHFRVTVDGKVHNASFTLVTKVRNYGGDFEIAREVKLQDADFEVVIFDGSRWQNYIQFLGGVMFNRLKHVNSVSIYRTSSVQVEPPKDAPIYIQADGEAVGRAPATITTLQDALTLLVPPKYLAR